MESLVDLQFYYLVSKPYDITYARDPAWYDHKGLDHNRRLFSKYGDTYVVTKEILNCSKIHHNILIASTHDLRSMYHGKAMNKFKYSCSKPFSTRQDIQTVLDYIFKEAKQRYFELYRDYKISLPR